MRKILTILRRLTIRIPSQCNISHAIIPNQIEEGKAASTLILIVIRVLPKEIKQHIRQEEEDIDKSSTNDRTQMLED